MLVISRRPRCHFIKGWPNWPVERPLLVFEIDIVSLNHLFEAKSHLALVRPISPPKCGSLIHIQMSYCRCKVILVNSGCPLVRTIDCISQEYAKWSVGNISRRATQPPCFPILLPFLLGKLWAKCENGIAEKRYKLKFKSDKVPYQRKTRAHSHQGMWLSPDQKPSDYRWSWRSLGQRSYV